MKIESQELEYKRKIDFYEKNINSYEKKSTTTKDNIHIYGKFIFIIIIIIIIIIENEIIFIIFFLNIYYYLYKNEIMFY